jgi:hypothetical protein
VCPVLLWRFRTLFFSLNLTTMAKEATSNARGCMTKQQIGNKFKIFLKYAISFLPLFTNLND